MKLRYSYHSEHNADKQGRWIHFSLFIGALILLFAGAQQLYLHFTAWTASDESHGWNNLIFGIAYLVAGGLLTWYGLRLKNAHQVPTDRYVRITEEELIWDLTQVEEERSIRLQDISTIERPNVRDLKIGLTSRQDVLIPIFLIADEEKQGELVNLLEEIVGKQA